jgi:hypothetical protein
MNTGFGRVYDAGTRVDRNAEEFVAAALTLAVRTVLLGRAEVDFEAAFAEVVVCLDDFVAAFFFF